MRGWQALTSGWDRPIQPERPRAPQSQRPRTKAPAREHLLPPEVRKALFDLHVVSQTALNEIDRVFRDRGMTKSQRINKMRNIRREFAK